MKNADLHTHSCYSDGQISPKNLVRLAKKRGIKHLALTDHESVKGVREAVAEGKNIGVNIIPSVEVGFRGGEMLGYFIDINNKDLVKALKENSKKIEGKTKELCKKLQKAKYKISFKELWNKYPKARGNINTFYPLYELHFKGYGSTLELAKKIQGSPKLRPKKIKLMNIFHAIKVIKKAGGVPVLAHPWIEDTCRHFKKMNKYVKAGLKGIELNNGDDLSFMKQKSKMKNIVSEIKKAAKKYNLVMTKGTDFHGVKIAKLMPGNHNLGKNNCEEKIVEKLRNLKHHNL